MDDTTVCVCGHVREAHEHFRRGTDCGTCGPEVCPRFRRARRSASGPAAGPRARLHLL